MASITYRVDGMTSGHCESAVLGELTSLDSVTDVSVDMHAGSTSNVTVASPAPLTDEQVAAVLNEAGDCHLVGADR